MAYFVDENICEFHGDEAESLLVSKNDRAFVTSDGILQVTPDRWHEAQRYERRTWMEQGINATDASNTLHLQHFAHYAAITGMSFNRAIELGCGPFTNIRLIMPLISVGKLDLLDPLIMDYLKHPHCPYANYPIDNFIPSSIENFIPKMPYNLVVMVNVLEHCYDIPKALARVRDMLTDDGVLVFGDVCASDIAAGESYDAGHPIRMTEGYLNGFLDGFTPLYSNRFVNPDHLKHRNICRYFIGEKAAPPYLKLREQSRGDGGCD